MLCYFVGYGISPSIYSAYDPITRKVFYTKDVIFDEEPCDEHVDLPTVGEESDSKQTSLMLRLLSTAHYREDPMAETLCYDDNPRQSRARSSVFQEEGKPVHATAVVCITDRTPDYLYPACWRSR